eukprot:jgi/Picre1/31428/NNA_006780.t1
MGNSKANQGPSTKIVQPKDQGRTACTEKRAPKLTNQVIKDFLVDVQKLKANECLKYTQRKHEILPFESGGEVELENFSSKSDCSLFILGNHTKKRPNNIILGRMYDYKLYDMMEFGVTGYKGIQEFDASTIPQLGNKPAFIFVGQEFTTHSVLKQAKSLLLDFFRGRQIEQINLKGLDRVIFVSHTPIKAGDEREAPLDVEKEAMKQPKLAPKKVKNVGSDSLDGKVGKIYVPRQDLDSIALNKMKGAKRERREAAAERKNKSSKMADS